MDQFLRGAIVAGCLVVGLFFLRFFRRSRDRLFLFFALSFFLLAAERFMLAVIESYNVPLDAGEWVRAIAAVNDSPQSIRERLLELRPRWIRSFANVPYWVRAFAYLLIITGIVDKNINTPRDERS
jgi:hypothetical protein